MRIAGWRWSPPLAALSLVLLQAVIAFRWASYMRYCGNFDAASYYSTARNVAQGRGLLDTCLWHCLGPSREVARPAGDYWLPGWPFVLGHLMRWFGTSFESVAHIMATLSLLLPLAVYAMVRSWGFPWYTGWLAGIMVCSLTELQAVFVTPDVSLSYSLVTLAGLIVLARVPDTPLPLAVAGAFCMLGAWFRGEGFIVWLAGLVVFFRPANPRALAAWGAGGLLVVLGHITYNQLAFNHLLPPPRSAIPWMVSYTDLYSFQELPDFDRWFHQGCRSIALNIFYSLRGAALEQVLQTPLALLLAAAAASRMLWREGRGGRAAVLFLAFSYLLPAILYPVVANGYRFALTALPMLCALAAPAMVAGFSRLRSALVRALAVAAFTGYFFFWPWPWHFGLTAPILSYLRPADLQPSLIQLLELQPDDVVMSEDPWNVSACLDVRAVMIPWNGDTAINRSIVLYHPRFLLARGRDRVAVFMEKSHLSRARVRMRVGRTTLFELTY